MAWAVAVSHREALARGASMGQLPANLDLDAVVSQCRSFLRAVSERRRNPSWLGGTRPPHLLAGTMTWPAVCPDYSRRLTSTALRARPVVPPLTRVLAESAHATPCGVQATRLPTSPRLVRQVRMADGSGVVVRGSVLGE
jgi:hypothetical protein